MELKNFIVKLKYKNEMFIKYTNDNHINFTKEEFREFLVKNRSSLVTHKEANRIMVTIISRDSWRSDDDKLEFISVVEISNYRPYSDYAVHSYREFK